MRFDCPQCGETIFVTRFDEWDTNAHGYEIVDGNCDCVLTQEQVHALFDAAHEEYMAGIEDPWNEPDY